MNLTRKSNAPNLHAAVVLVCVEERDPGDEGHVIVRVRAEVPGVCKGQTRVKGVSQKD